MKHTRNYLIFSIITLFSVNQLSAQSSAFLDVNNIKARVNANNYLFTDPAGTSVGYEYPVNSGKSTIFSANLMMLGLDVNGQIKGMIPQINNSTDLYAGPIMDAQYYATSAQIWDRVWKINCSEITTFKVWYQAGVDDAINGTTNQATNFPGYQIPTSIIDWPGNGDVSKGQLLNIAPFFDRNGDNYYDPNAGDYPLIKGDQAIFFVYNDERPTWNIVNNRTEVRVMVYAFNGALDSALNNTVFVNYEIINRSTATLNNAHIGFDVDFDIGNPSDDFIGSVARGSFYGYNGDNFDENANGALGYGTNHAAQSVVVLKGNYIDADGVDNPFTPIIQDVIDSNGVPYACFGTGFSDAIVDNETSGLEHFMAYDFSTGAQGAPTTGVDYYNYIESNWKDGSQLVYGGNGHANGGGTVPANYIYVGSSDPLYYSTNGIIAAPSNWSENSAGNPPGDRKGIGSMRSFTLSPGAVNIIDIALVSAIDYTGSGNLAAVTIMNERIDLIKSYYCNGLLSECSGNGLTTGIESIKNNLAVSVYPNPFVNELTVNYKLQNNNATLTIFNLIGENIYTTTLSENSTQLSLTNFDKGIYFIKIIDGENSLTKKIVKQ